MELTKQELQKIVFRTRGKWYRAEDVDRFMEELMVRADELKREKDAQRDEVREAKKQSEDIEEKLRGDIVRLEQELKEEKAREHLPETARRGKKICEELEQERDELIEDIRSLRRFRENFRLAVEQDAKDVLQKLQDLSSRQLL